MKPLSRIYSNSIGKLLEFCDDRYARICGYVPLKDVMSAFGSLPTLPWNGQKIEIRQGWVSSKVYVFLSVYENPFAILKQSAQQKQEIVRLRMKDLGYHAFEVIRELQRLGERAKAEGIECILKHIEIKPDFSEMPI